MPPLNFAEGFGYTLQLAKRAGCPAHCPEQLHYSFDERAFGKVGYTIQHGENREGVLKGSTDIWLLQHHSQSEELFCAIVAWLQELHASQPGAPQPQPTTPKEEPHGPYQRRPRRGRSLLPDLL